MNKLSTRKIYFDEYPLQLKQLNPIFPEMTIAGDLPKDECKYLCVIGSRNHSDYGKELCNYLFKGLKGYPIVIVSGLAIGIDSIAHQSAIENGLKTIAFPGSGLSINSLYPTSRRDLALKILSSGGALISPFKDFQSGERWTFPVRNRLMAGISHAILIIEAKKGSGTLLTAEYATEFNRDILAVPGSIFSDLSYGPHMLIRNGATPITSSKDILQALGFETNNNPNTQTLLNIESLNLLPEEKQIINFLQLSSYSSSALIEKTGLNPIKFNTIISELELKELINEKAGIYSIRR